ncbi:hypothetical protein [Amycolatopsis sp. NPDC003731]
MSRAHRIDTPHGDQPHPVLTMLNTKNKAQRAWALLDQQHQVPKQLAALRQFQIDRGNGENLFPRLKG